MICQATRLEGEPVSHTKRGVCSRKTASERMPDQERFIIMTRRHRTSSRYQPAARWIAATALLTSLFLTISTRPAQAGWPQMVLSEDGTPIAYEIHGQGDPTLVFVHGWSCDARYWRAQLSHFARSHRVLVLDLAGHGHSGATRKRYTMRAFGEDVRAVTEAAASDQVILIGHSMGGPVVAEAARLMPQRVKGLIGIDTLENVEYPMTVEEANQMVAPLERDFPAGCRQFVQEMLSPRTGSELREWILADMAAAPPAVAISAMKEMVSQYLTGEAARIFDEVRLPVITVNGDLWPIDHAANRRHMLSFEAIVLKGADHFLMLDRPEAFNRALEQAIDMLGAKAAGQP